MYARSYPQPKMWHTPTGEGTQKLGQHNEMGSRVFKNSLRTHQAIKSEKKIGGKFEPRVGRVVDGIPDRVDRIKCLGNSVVPQIPYLIGLSILKKNKQINGFNYSIRWFI